MEISRWLFHLPERSSPLGPLRNSVHLCVPISCDFFGRTVAHEPYMKGHAMMVLACTSDGKLELKLLLLLLLLLLPAVRGRGTGRACVEAIFLTPCIQAGWMWHARAGFTCYYIIQYCITWPSTQILFCSVYPQQKKCASRMHIVIQFLIKNFRSPRKLHFDYIIGL